MCPVPWRPPPECLCDRQPYPNVDHGAIVGPEIRTLRTIVGTCPSLDRATIFPPLYL